MVSLIVADGDWVERFEVDSTEEIEAKYHELEEKYKHIELRKSDDGKFFISCGDTEWWKE
jgi:hypothetical protein